MYVSFYNLSGRPFQLSPDPRFFFEGRAHKKVMAYLAHGLNEGDGFLVVTGEVGAGKTTVIGHLLNQLDKRKYITAKIVTTQVEADDALRLVASVFRLPFEGMDKATLLRSIEVFLAEVRRQKKHPILIVDEAQNMPISALEELRLLTNLERDHHPLLQCFLLGQPQFRSRIAQEDMEQLRQRIIAACHLSPLGPDETRAYIEHRLGMVGWQNDPDFTDQAFEAIHRHTQGVPRRINSLCGRLLLFGYLEELHHIDDEVVIRIVQELEDETGQYLAPSEETSVARSASAAPPANPAPVIEGPSKDSALTTDYEETLRELERRVASLKRP